MNLCRFFIHTWGKWSVPYGLSPACQQRRCLKCNRASTRHIPFSTVRREPPTLPHETDPKITQEPIGEAP